MNIQLIRFLKNKKYQKFFIITLILSFIISFLLFKKLDNSLLLKDLTNISNLLKTNHLNYFILHLIILTILILTSLLGLYFLIFPLYLFFEEICIFYHFFSFISIYHFKGLIFSLIFNLLTKTVYLYIIFLISLKISSLTKTFFHNLSLSKPVKYPYYLTLKKLFFLVILIFLYDLFLYLFGNLILSKLTFILN